MKFKMFRTNDIEIEIFKVTDTQVKKVSFIMAFPPEDASIKFAKMYWSLDYPDTFMEVLVDGKPMLMLIEGPRFKIPEGKNSEGIIVPYYASYFEWYKSVKYE
jgi:hypothetical protein